MLRAAAILSENWPSLHRPVLFQIKYLPKLRAKICQQNKKLCLGTCLRNSRSTRQ